MLCLFIATSCEDKEAIQKNEELRVQIVELEKKIGLMEIEAGEDPGDQSVHLKHANEELAKALKTLESLDDEKTALEEQQKQLVKEFRAYQQKYQVKE